MAKRSLLDLATEDDLLAIFRRNAQEVLDGEKENVRLTLDDFEDARQSEPKIIITVSGVRRVNWALRKAALKALQAELGMGEVVYRELRSGPPSGRLVMSTRHPVIIKKMFATDRPNVFFVKITSWWKGRKRANRVVWFLVRINTSKK